jgi:hypothetical protein
MNTFPELVLKDGCLLIDNSTYEKIQTCPRSALYYMLYKREKNIERSSLQFGKILHTALEWRAKNPRTPEPHRTTQMLDQVFKQFQAYTPPEDDFRNYGFMVDVVRKYNQTYPEDHPVAETTDGKPLVEVPFMVPLGEVMYQGRTIPLMWTGRIDRIYRYDGRLYGMDHKTTSVMGPSFFKEFELSTQLAGYTNAIQTLTGECLSGFVIDAIAIRKPTKTGTSIEFHRQTFACSTEQINEFKQDVICTVQGFLEQIDYGFVPKNTKWCFGKYGECQYFNTCTLPSFQRLTMLNTNDYRPVTWSPLA